MAGGADAMDNECRYREVVLRKQPGGVYMYIRTIQFIVIAAFCPPYVDGGLLRHYNTRYRF